METNTRPTAPQRNVVTERPPSIQRRSMLGMRRGQTSLPKNEGYHASFWDSDSTSSSDEEAHPSHPTVTRSNTDSHTASKRSFLNGDPYRRYALGNQNYATHGKVSKKDGRLKINLSETADKGYLAKTLEATLKHHRHPVSSTPGANDVGNGDGFTPRPRLLHAGTMSTIDSVASIATSHVELGPVPKLNVVIMVIGSRGDIQPFLRLGKILAEKHGHRVRLATHPAFREFVESETSIEFFSVGGDPAELMAFMVKNPGLIPKAKTIREGEIARRRESMYEMFKGFWRACINTTDEEHDIANAKMMGGKHPFVADVIIANPPSFAHVHCAERLGVPLHLMFTFPMSPTQNFPHPLANIKRSTVDSNYANFMSYPLVEMMTWQGLGDLVNRFRVKSLGLDPISTLWAPGQLFRMRVPYSYLWSPALIPKPSDWGPEIDISGFVFLNLADSFKPDQELVNFLEAGEPPIYIGFGSIVVDDPEAFTELIFEAVEKAGVRALVSKGWGGIGGDSDTPDNIFMLGNTPHDWLFPRVSAVIHHGGAGSTAIGLKCGKPTAIVPFFGDQPFWGAMVAKSGAGAEPVPYKKLTSDILAESIKTILSPECQEKAKEVAEKIANEGDGAVNAISSFHSKLPLRGNHSMRCSILDDRVTVWWLKGTHVRLSSLAAEILVVKGKIRWRDLRLIRHFDWNDFEGPGEPFTGAGGAILGSAGEFVQAAGSAPRRWVSTLKKRKNQKASESSEPSQEEDSVPRSPKGGKSEQDGKPSNPASATRPHKTGSGSSKMPPLPAANLGEGRLRHELSQHKGSGEKSSTLIPDPDAKKNSLGGNTFVHGVNAATESHKLSTATGLASGTKEGVVRSGKALVKAPIDLSVAIAQGFHNAPRLWGDETVRTPRRINGFKSGMVAARDEVAFGVYDGWTGLVRQPLNGARHGGAFGFVKGVGKGIGGFVMKDLAAIAGAQAYPIKGLQKQLSSNTNKASDFIRKARIIDGRNAFDRLSEKERNRTCEEVSEGWRIIAEVLNLKQEYEKHGLKGRIMVQRNRKKWKQNAVFENVEQMNQALAAQREGKDFERVFAAHRHQVDKAKTKQTPREVSAQATPRSDKTPRTSKEVDRSTTKQRASRLSMESAKDENTDNSSNTETNKNLAVSSSQNQKGVNISAKVEMAGRQTGTSVVDQAEPTKHIGPMGSEKQNGTASAKAMTEQAPDEKVDADGQVSPEVPTQGLLKPAVTF